MLRLFRRVFNYSEKLNWKKTLLYAGGEILLIFIGINLALYYNNLDAKKNNKEKEELMLNEMLAELEHDYGHFSFKLGKSKEKKKANQILLNHIENQIPYNDSLAIYFGQAVQWTSTLPSTSTFQTLNNSGFSLIANDSIRILAQNLYNRGYPYCIEVEKWRMEFHFNAVVPFEKMKFRRVEWISESVPIDGQALLESQEYEYILNVLRTLALQEIQVYTNTLKSIENLIELLNRQLED